jgi:catechol 2,3-dioxygenase-like lactoylglutathione lyase family enzyme
MRIGSIVVRCLEFEKMLAFWSEALHYVPRYPPENGWVILGDPEGRGPNISLDRVPPEKHLPHRGRLHLDLYTGQQEKEVERLVALGAKRYPWRYPPGADYLVLEDPDGNLFCVVQM